MNNIYKTTILTEYEEQKALVALAEKRIIELRDQILQIGSGQHGGFVVLITDQTRESFSLKEAKATLTESVWMKIAPFVKTTAFKNLKVARI